MKSQVFFILFIFSNSEIKVWGSFFDETKVLDTEDEVWEPLDTNLIEFQKQLSTLDFEPIGSDCGPDVELIKESFEDTNEDVHLNAFELLTKRRVKHEVFTVETCDGYLLTFVRIPGDGPVVLINHGLLNSFIDFFTSGTESGLGHILHKAGYDLWFTNCRGNTHSRNHVTLSPEDEKFWHFSWHQIGTRDLPAFIDFALCKTGKKRLIYIGFSQGTTSVLVLLSNKPEYNKKLKLVILLSPVAFMNNAKSPLLRALSPFHDQVHLIFKLFGKHELFPRHGFEAAVKDVICYPATPICNNLVFLLAGFDCEQLNYTALPVQYSKVPAGASIRQVIHYFQLAQSKKFRNYDHGKEKNSITYGTADPPDYNLTNICAPIALFRAENDWLSDLRDVKRLVKKLPNVVKNYLVPFKKFNHLDFIWAKDAKKLLYNEVMELISKYTCKNKIV